MKPINIPAKHIYEMQNSKVIDNNINRIEVQAKTVVNVNENNIIVFCNNYDDLAGTKLPDNEGTSGKTGIVAGNMISDISNAIEGIEMAAAYAAYINQEYVTLNIVIPKKIKNSKIIKVRTVNDEGKNNIGIVTYSNIYKGNASQDWNISVTNDRDTSKATATINSKSYIAYNQTNYSNNTMNYNIVDSLSIDKRAAYKVASAKATNSNKGNQGDLTENSSNYYISITIPLKSTAITMADNKTDFTVHTAGTRNYTLNVKGTYETVIVTRIELTVYGDTLGIDLQDNIIKIGTGKNSMSFSGNELIQTTNNPTPQKVYQKILDDWKNGKETVTLRLGIADYYRKPILKYFTILDKYKISENSNIIRVITSNLGGYQATMQLGTGAVLTYIRDIDKSDPLYKPEYGEEPVELWETTAELNEIPKPNEESSGQVSELAISKDGAYGLPMTIPIGEIIVPNVYDVDGQNKPMSLSDTKYKQFKVLGNRIIYDGGVWQELTCQEYLPNSTPITASVKISSILGESEGYSYFEIDYISGTKPIIRDIISFEGEKGAIVDKVVNQDSFMLRVKSLYNGNFESALGQTITVEFV